MDITTIGLDLAKSVSHVVCCNQAGKIVRKKMLRRTQILHFFSELAPCLVGVESCASAHYWAREIAKYVEMPNKRCHLDSFKSDLLFVVALAYRITIHCSLRRD